MTMTMTMMNETQQYQMITSHEVPSDRRTHRLRLCCVTVFSIVGIHSMQLADQVLEIVDDACGPVLNFGFRSPSERGGADVIHGCHVPHSFTRYGFVYRVPWYRCVGEMAK
jgi:hypothetical protein